MTRSQRLSGAGGLVLATILLIACSGPEEERGADDGVANRAQPKAPAPRTPASHKRPQSPGDPGTTMPQPSACRTQDDSQLTAATLKALGTEPFWAALIDGRCITYSTPEDREGTRIWTRFTPGPDGGMWSGAFDDRQFELRTRPAPPPGCSDGMSDRRYTSTVTLRVRGETRHGCADPAAITATED